jgi:tetratricopeptide (TPR) repeat protein
MHNPQPLEVSVIPSASQARRPSWAEPLVRWARRGPWMAVLLAGVTLLLLGLGMGWWLQAERGQRTAEEQRRQERWLDLKQRLRELEDAERWTEVQALAEEGRRQAWNDARRQEAVDWLGEVELAQRLDGVRQHADVFDYKRDLDKEYAEILAGLALMEGSEAEAGERVRGSGAWRALLRALDDWAARTKDKARAARLLALGRRLDPGWWKDKVRDPVLWDDPDRLTRLVKEWPVQELSPELVYALGVKLPDLKEKAAWLRRGQRVHSSDYWLAAELNSTLLLTHEYDEALAYAMVTVALRPDLGSSWFRRGLAWYDKGVYDRAIEDYDQALHFDSRHVPTYYNRGLAWYSKGEYDKAIQDQDRAIQIDDRFGPAYNNRGLAWQARGEYDKAIGDFVRVMQIDPSYVQAYSNQAWILATCPRSEIRNGPKAVGLSTQACEQTRWKNDDAVETLAAAQAEVGNFPEAIRLQKKVLEHSPGYQGHGAQRLKHYEAGQAWREP